MLLTTKKNYLFCGLHIYLDKESKIIIGQEGNFCNRSICPIISHDHIKRMYMP
jgi:hypothetical protein